MPYMTSDGLKSVGYRVQYRGRYNKWMELGLYCSREAAEHFINHWHQRPADKYRIVEQEC